MYVLDSSAFILEVEASDDLASVSGVRRELESSALYRYEAMEGAGMKVLTPSDDAREAVESAARDTGDLGVLSSVDVDVLAAAYDVDGVLVSDDYAVQNVAEELEVEYEAIGQDEISEHRSWVYQCQGCGRTSEDSGVCVVCGAEKTRKNPG
ncbi:MAG: NOB1 family endonuclease [Halobacteriales archaeon]